MGLIQNAAFDHVNLFWPFPISIRIQDFFSFAVNPHFPASLEKEVSDEGRP
jgi:hypothetical protein